MSFLSSVFGGGASTPPPPTPLPAAPTISAGDVAAANVAESARLKNRYGTDKTILTGLGDNGGKSGNDGSANVQRTTLLGGQGTVSQ